MELFGGLEVESTKLIIVKNNVSFKPNFFV